MFLNTYPLFNRGRTLKIEMLEQLRDFPRDFINILLEQYSDGIITGCELSVNNHYLVIAKGIVKHGGTLYMLKESCSVAYESTNTTVMLKIRFLDETKNNDFIRSGTEIFIDDDLDIKTDELELCRFKAKTGARLRVDYINFEDMSTEYDTVNLINSPFAAPAKSSLSPSILKTFAKEAFKYPITNALDAAFCMQCLQTQETLNREMIQNYLSARLRQELREYSNEEIYKYLLQILGDISQGRERSQGNRSFGGRSIMVD